MMMKKTLLAAAVASCITGSMTAQAINLSSDGSGQVLLYPYYNVQEGNTTFFSVTNTTSTVKAVKVRLREGVGSEDVLDFSLYLSPKDVWVGALFQQNDQVFLKVPADTSCTAPVRSRLVASPLSAQRIRPEYDPDSSGTQEPVEVLDRLSEGHIEVIEMAELPYDDGPDNNLIGGNDVIADAVTHVDGVPEDCEVPTIFSGNQTDAILTERTVQAGNVTQGGDTGPVRQRFERPGGGLIGAAAVFNDSTGIYFPYNAVAMENYATLPLWWPQNAILFTSVEGAPGGRDNFGNPIENYFTADQGWAIFENRGTLNFDLPDLSTPDSLEVEGGVGVDPLLGISLTAVFTKQIATDDPTIHRAAFLETKANGDVRFAQRDATTAALMGTVITGDYLTSGEFSTDWVVTFPTRYLHVYDTANRSGGNPDLDTPLLPIDEAFAVDPFTISEDETTGKACHDIEFDYWDREESKNLTDTGVTVSPGIPQPGFPLCFQVNVLSLNDEGGDVSKALASRAVRTEVPLEFTDGWAVLDMTDYNLSTVADGLISGSRNFTGLPVVGFSAVANTVQGVERGGVFASRVGRDRVIEDLGDNGDGEPNL